MLESAAGGGRPELGDGDFWALDGLKDQLGLVGDAAADGGVLFTGAVRLPAGERYEWQYGALTAGLLGTDEDRPDWTEAAEPLAALGHPVRLRLLREILAVAHRRRAGRARPDGHDRAGLPPPADAHRRRLAAHDGAGALRGAGRPGRAAAGGPHGSPAMIR